MVVQQTRAVAKNIKNFEASISIANPSLCHFIPIKFIEFHNPFILNIHQFELFLGKAETDRIGFQGFPESHCCPGIYRINKGNTISYWSSGFTNLEMTSNDINWIVPGIGGMTGDTMDERLSI